MALISVAGGIFEIALYRRRRGPGPMKDDSRTGELAEAVGIGRRVEVEDT